VSGPLLILVLAVGLWLAGDERVARARQAGTTGQTPPGVLNDQAYFEKLKQQAAELQKQADALNLKISQAAQPHLDAQAAAHGGQEQARRAAGASLADINARLAARAAAAGSSQGGPRIEPGMKMTVLLKSNAKYYTGTLVGVRDGKLLLQTIPEPGAKPSEFELKDIAAFQISAGIFAYNPNAGKIVPALTCYRFNKATGNFDRMDSCPGDVFLAEHAQVVGPTKSTPALFDSSADGTWAVGLPVPFDNSTPRIPAASFQKVITSEGVYTYDPQAKGYNYKSHAAFAREAQAQKDAAGQAYYKQQWDHDTQQYQLQTNRIQAMQPVFSWPWSGGAAPWYAQPQPPQSPQP
jgi:hypothetical protein